MLEGGVSSELVSESEGELCKKLSPFPGDRERSRCRKSAFPG